MSTYSIILMNTKTNTDLDLYEQYYLLSILLKEKNSKEDLEKIKAKKQEVYDLIKESIIKE